MFETSGVAVWAEGIRAELLNRLPDQRKTQRDKLSVLVATMLHVGSANLVELASGLPRESDRWDMGYQYISRFLANDLVDCDTVMEPFAREILDHLAATGRPVPLILDQSKVSDRHQVLMLSVRWGERALPIAWRVEETEGAIGFTTQKELLDTVSRWLPEGQAVVLLADRFYGTPDMITWCRDTGWDYRLRLKGNLTARLGSRTQTTGELVLSGVNYFENVALTVKRVTTNIGIIRDPGHPEPWIIAMSATPGYLTTLAYADRWGIEPMFSDFKSRGFGIQQTHLQHPDRLGRLILVMALALYWAVSTGMWDQANNPTPVKKKTRPSAQKSRKRKAILVHKRHPKSRQTLAPMHPPPKTLGPNPKLIDGKMRGFPLRTVAIVAFAAAAVVTSRSALAQNLVVNPGFEDSTDSMTSEGWTLGQTFGYTYFEDNSGDAHTGNWSATFGDTQPVTLSQTIATVPDTTYLVSFYLADNSTGSGGKSFVAVFGGQTVLSLTNSTATGYMFYSAQVVASSSQSVLSFTAENPPGQFNLDDVSVEVEGAPAPMPGTGAFSLMAGVAMLASLGFRRMRGKRA